MRLCGSYGFSLSKSGQLLDHREVVGDGHTSRTEFRFNFISKNRRWARSGLSPNQATVAQVSQSGFLTQANFVEMFGLSNFGISRSDGKQQKKTFNSLIFLTSLKVCSCPSCLQASPGSEV